MKHKITLILLVGFISIVACSNTNDANPLPTVDDNTFNVQYIRTYCYDTDYSNRNPTVIVLSSRNELEQQFADQCLYRGYDEDGFWETRAPEYFLAKYSDDYFANNFLVIIKLIEAGGSTRHSVETIDKNGDIVINRFVPEAGYTDIAVWNMLIELKKSSKLEQYQAILVDVRI